MAIKHIKEKSLTWVNIDKIDDQSLKFLADNYNFHHLDLEDLRGESQTPKLDVYKNYLFVVLQFPQWNAKLKKVVSHEMDVFLGKDFLITIQHNKSKELKNFFFRCMKNKRIKSKWMSKNSGYLFYKILEALFRNSQPILNNLGKLLSKIEEEVFKGEAPDSVLVKQLAMHRRNILAFRRILDPQRYLVSNIANIRNDYFDATLTLYFDDINDYLNKIWSIMDGYKDTVEGLHTTVESLINRRTNKIIETLTIISVCFMPLTLLSGIYGMNISLPYQQQPNMVWLLFGILLAIITIIVILMRNRRML